ncbi:type II secretion system protein GspG [Serratia symbiotica]|nr:type II secretion system protein GspG [Serratia symbiotica]
MKILSDMLSQYRLDVGQYPSETHGLKALIDRPSVVTGWREPYLSKSVPSDPWGNHYQWHNPTRNKNAVYEVELLATGNDDKIINYGF